MGHQLPADHGAGCVALPLSDGRYLEPQSGGLGWGRGRIGPDRSGSGAAGLPQGALPPPQRLWQQPVPAVATDPQRRQRQCTSRRLLEELRGATLESQLEELGILRSFSRPRVSNHNPYSEYLFHTVKYRPDYPSRPFASKEEACDWWCHSLIGTTTSTAAAASNSRRPNSATAELLKPFPSREQRSTRQPARPIQHAGAGAPAARDSRQKCGSTSHWKSPIRSWRYH